MCLTAHENGTGKCNGTVSVDVKRPGVLMCKDEWDAPAERSPKEAAKEAIRAVVKAAKKGKELTLNTRACLIRVFLEGRATGEFMSWEPELWQGLRDLVHPLCCGGFETDGHLEDLLRLLGAGIFVHEHWARSDPSEAWDGRDGKRSWYRGFAVANLLATRVTDAQVDALVRALSCPKADLCFVACVCRPPSEGHNLWCVGLRGEDSPHPNGSPFSGRISTACEWLGDLPELLSRMARASACNLCPAREYDRDCDYDNWPSIGRGEDGERYECLSLCSGLNPLQLNCPGGYPIMLALWDATWPAAGERAPGPDILRRLEEAVRESGLSVVAPVLP